VIPYGEAEALANAWPGLKFMTTTGKGHRDILSASEVIRAIVDFVDPGVVPDSQSTATGPAPPESRPPRR